jgi:thioredoxin-like negative regulator of GroEL
MQQAPQQMQQAPQQMPPASAVNRPQRQAPRSQSKLLSADVETCTDCGAEMIDSVCNACGGRFVPETKSKSPAGLLLLVVGMVVLIGAGIGITQFISHGNSSDPKYAEEEMKRAETELEQGGEAESALVKAQNATQAAPKNSYLQLRFAAMFLKLEREDEAMQHGEMAATISPNDKTVQESYAALLDKMGNHSEKSIAQYEKVMKLLPDHPQAFLWAAEACRRSEQYEKAIPFYKQYIKMAPDTFEGAWIGLSTCQEKTGHLKEAIETLRTASQKYDAPEIQDRLKELQRAKSAK